MMTLPATDADVLAQAIDPALEMLPPRMRSDQARVMLLAIGRQESNFAARVQGGNGPARGLWQFERGGVLGAMHHHASAEYFHRFVRDCRVTYGSGPVYDALATDDVLAASVARLLLWTDPKPLPTIGDADAAWTYYLRLWRPGKPGPDRWANAYRLAVEALR